MERRSGKATQRQWHSHWPQMMTVLGRGASGCRNRRREADEGRHTDKVQRQKYVCYDPGMCLAVKVIFKNNWVLIFF